MFNDPKGSYWRKWDLHVHTPASLVHHYGGDADVWEKFIADLENLPPEFKVIGINDYIFIDGYRRILEEKKAGRLKNIDLILPVIELRIDKFGGTKNHLSRVNFHVIFSDEVPPDYIQTQFLNGITTDYKLSAALEGKGIHWNAIITQDSLTDLGKKIIDSVPAAERVNFSSPIIEGFNNINFDFETVLDRLKSHYFEGSHLTAVGKTEWADIKWNDHSIADKKNIINNADFVFMSADSVETYNKAKKKLVKEHVNSRLLDCSDAHRFSSDKDKDRIGKCFTWIKADPTFEGLKQALLGYEERVFVGEFPSQLKSVASKPTKYVKSIRIEKKPESTLNEIWFDGTGEIDFNPGLVAIIGNKGNAKSALTDIIGLLGNTKNDKHFSFLEPRKFRLPGDNKSKHFTAQIIFESGNSYQRSLDEKVHATDVERVKYIPQNFFEVICNEVAYQEGGIFDRELEQVIFSHVSIPQRLGKNSLRELIDHRTSEINDAISQIQLEIQSINKEIVQIETQLQPEFRQSIVKKLASKQLELDAHLNAKPEEIADPSKALDGQKTSTIQLIDEKRNAIKQIELEIKVALKKQGELAISESEIQKAENKINNFQQNYKKYEQDFDQLKIPGIKFSDLVKIEVNRQKLEVWKTYVVGEKSQVDGSLDEANEGSLLFQQSLLQDQLKDLQNKLDEPNKQYQKYLKSLEQWKKIKQEITGTASTNDTIKYYQEIHRKLDELPKTLQSLMEKRLSLSRDIYSNIERLAQIYKELYTPVQDFIERHPLANNFSLHFDVSIVDKEFRNKFFEWVNQSVAGTFCGIAPGQKKLEEILSNYNFNNIQDTISFLNYIVEALTKDLRLSINKAIKVSDQMKKNQSVASLYDYIFSLTYLKPHYVLKMSGKEMFQLSPGEKGALLLIFYLLIDLEDIPLIIDQPEENLDNQTVYDLLVPSIDEARQRRQIFIVSHNPNLAVVCDAEQIIYAAIDKKNKNKVEYMTGATENKQINKKLLDVLGSVDIII